ncbi:MAG: hypothetical protein E7360_05805 [Clostridiales bacterium]|nr:hypothetical protein [Clostridiales bacterium]
MKKLLFIVFTLAILFCFVACETDNLSSEESFEHQSNSAFQSESDSQSTESNESVYEEKLEISGEEVEGNTQDFLYSVNSALTLKDGVTDYFISVRLNNGNNNVYSQNATLKLHKQGDIDYFYVNAPIIGVDGYSDFNYTYIIDGTEKIRVDKTEVDYTLYVEDLEELYALGDVESVKAYKDGFVMQYLINFKLAYAKKEFGDILAQYGTNMLIKNCYSIFVCAENSVMEELHLEFVVQGVNCEIISYRQFSIDENYIFPDFNSFTETYSKTDALSDVAQAIAETKLINSYSIQINDNGNEVFSYSVKGGQAISLRGINSNYYKDGKNYTYDRANGEYIVKHYTYEEFYQNETAEYTEILDYDLGLTAESVEYAIKTQTNAETVYKFKISIAGAGNLVSGANSNCYITYKLQDGIINTVEISRGNEEVLKLSLNREPTLVFPDKLSEDRILIDKNDILDIKCMVKDSTFFGYGSIGHNMFVDYQTGDIFIKDNGATLLRYDKNHNLINTYELKMNSLHDSFGGFLGANSTYIYYSVYDGYSTSSEGEAYSLNKADGSSTWLGYGINYSYYPVAVVNSTLYYQSADLIMTKNNYSGYTNYVSIDGVDDYTVKHYDLKNNLLIINGYYYNGEGFLATLDVATKKIVKNGEYTYLTAGNSYACMSGDGYYNENGVFRLYEDIGKSVTPSYIKVYDAHPERYYSSEKRTDWQIVKDTEKYLFTTYCVYEKSTGRNIYFDNQAEYRFFEGGVHVTTRGRNVIEDETLYTFFF